MIKRFLPVYYLKMASDLKRGIPRAQIARQMSEKYGIPERTAATYLSSVFPSGKLKDGASIDSLLWEKRKTVLSSADRRKKSLKAVAAMTPEQRSERGRKAAVAMKPEHRTARRERFLKMIESLTPEQRSASARKAQASLTPEQRSAAARKAQASLTAEQREARNALLLRYAHSPPHEETARRAQMTREMIASLTHEERSAHSRRVALEYWARLSPAERNERMLKAAASWSPEKREERRQRFLEMLDSLSREEKSNRTVKSHVSRMRALFGGIEYVNDLPELNLLTEAERGNLFEQHFGLVDDLVGKYWQREDFGDVQGVANLAFFVALAKWDKKMDLKKLVKDQIKFDLIMYFIGEKGAGMRKPLDERD